VQHCRAIRALILGLVLVLGLGTGALAGCGGRGATGGAPALPPADTLDIRDFQFSAGLTVGPGATVTVHNADGSVHDVTGNDGMGNDGMGNDGMGNDGMGNDGMGNDGTGKRGFDSGRIPAGGTATFSAPRAAGTYGFTCSIHSYMTGTLVVTG